MKAIVYEGVGKINLRDVEKPRLKNDNVIVKVKACAICGTDYKAYTIGISSIKPPVILGHEFVGEIVEIGNKIKDFKVGDRVTMATTIPCGHCEMCIKGFPNLCYNKMPVGTYINGAFAEYLEVPWEGIVHGNLIKIPDNLSDEHGAVAEPLGCAINSQNIASVGFPDTVAVIGAGPLGILQAELAKARGASRVILIQRSKKRYELAKSFNIDHLICSEIDDPVKSIKEITKGNGVDVVINAAPSRGAVELSFKLVSKTGRVSLFASVPKDNPFVNIDVNFIHYNQVSVFGSSDSTAKNHRDAVDLLASKKISTDKLITHILPIENFFKGMEAIKNREALKVVIKPSI